MFGHGFPVEKYNFLLMKYLNMCNPDNAVLERVVICQLEVYDRWSRVLKKDKKC